MKTHILGSIQGIMRLLSAAQKTKFQPIGRRGEMIVKIGKQVLLGLLVAAIFFILAFGPVGAADTCTISGFVGNPPSPVTLGTVVQFSADYNCGKGVRKVEYGVRMGVLENGTWDTSQTGVGSFEISLHVYSNEDTWGHFPAVAKLNFEVLPASAQAAATATPGQQVQAAQPGYVVINTTQLNVRSGPGTQYEVLSQVPKGTWLLYVATSSDKKWYEVTMADGSGWVSADYATLGRGTLEVYHPPTPFPTATPNILTATPTGEAEEDCSPAPAPRLVVNQKGRVVFGEGPSSLRQEPRGTENLVSLDEGTEFLVVEGPICLESSAAYTKINWWKVMLQGGRTGWISEGANGTYWLEPVWAPVPTPAGMVSPTPYPGQSRLQLALEAAAEAFFETLFAAEG